MLRSRWFRLSNPWNDATIASCPWLAVWFPAIEAGTVVTVVVTSPDGAVYTPFTDAVYQGTEAAETVITVNPAEAGIEAFAAGVWNVTVTDAAGAVLSKAQI